MDSSSDSEVEPAHDQEDIGWVFEHSDDESTDPNNAWFTPELQSTTVTFDEANHCSWQQAKYEILTARANMKRILNLDNYQGYKLEKLLQLVFSRLWEKIGSSISFSAMTESSFSKNVITFFFISSFGMSCSDFYTNDFIQKTMCSTHADYKQFWKLFYDLDTGKHDESKLYSWQRLMDIINELCRELFLANYDINNRKFITVDDDKDHYAGKMSWNETSGLKPSQFVRENRRGFTFHTLVYTSSGLPLGIEPETTADVSFFDTTTRLLVNQLAPSHRSRVKVPSLTTLTLFADRLYWANNFLDFIIKSGAQLHGTHKRGPNFPFTYEQKKNINDSRMHLTKKGGKMICIKHRNVGPYKLGALAYRDGHSKIVLGISSIHNQIIRKHWDLNLKRSDDRRKILDRFSFEWDVLDTWIKNVNPKHQLSDVFCDLMRTKTSIQAVTTTGSDDQSWFIARAFSFSSSTSDYIVNACISKMNKVGSSNFDNELTTSITPINLYLCKPNIVDYIECVNVDHINRLDVTQRKIEYRKMTKASLVVLCQTRLTGTKGSYERMSIEKLVEILSNHVHVDPTVALHNSIKKKIIENSFMTPLSGRVKQNCRIGLENESFLLDQLLIQSSTVLLISPSPLANSSIQDPSPSLTCSIKVNELYKPGMVMRKEKQFMKDSIDALGIIVVHGPQNVMLGNVFQNGIILFGVEIKTRTEESTRLPELECLAVEHQAQPFVIVHYQMCVFTLRCFHHFFLIIDIKSRLFDFSAHRYIKSVHELLQILHHATVYDLQVVLLLIGDRHSIIRGVYVYFDEAIRSSYEKFLNIMYDNTLTWAYDNHNNSNSALIDMHQFIPSHVGKEAFMDFYELWKTIMSSPTKLPIPQSTHILPAHFSLWNKMKGALRVLLILSLSLT